MASTYTYQNVYDQAVLFSRNVTIPSAQQILLADMVNNEIWVYPFPWRWTLSNLTAISLVDDTQDYTVGDSDFFVLTKAWLTRTDLTPDEYHMLDIVDFLPTQLSVKQQFRIHRSIAYQKVAGNDRLRLEYAAEIPSGVTVQIDGEYKQTPTKITALSQVIPFDDRYLQVAVNGLVYYIYRLDNDPRAGDMRIDKSGDRVYTGAFGTYMNSLWAMASAEDAYARTQFPSESFGAFDSVAPGLFF